MAKVKLSEQNIVEIAKFEIKCFSCGSVNCEVVIDYSHYPESISNNTFIICKDCEKEEELIND
jgi:DNA-directed RNA polymerase subunit N (RpoN/RPB10)